MLLPERPRHLGTFLGGLFEGCRSNPAVTSCLPAHRGHSNVPQKLGNLRQNLQRWYVHSK